MEGKWRKLLEYSIISEKETECGGVERCSFRKKTSYIFQSQKNCPISSTVQQSDRGEELPIFQY